MFLFVRFYVLSTVQSYGNMKFLPRRMKYLEIITNFASHNR